MVRLYSNWLKDKATMIIQSMSMKLSLFCSVSLNQNEAIWWIFQKKEESFIHSFSDDRRNVIELVHFDPLVKKCGSHFRIFRDEEEDHFADFISTVAYIMYGDFLEIALAFYNEKYIPLINFNDEREEKSKIFLRLHIRMVLLMNSNTNLSLQCVHLLSTNE